MSHLANTGKGEVFSLARLLHIAARLGAVAVAAFFIGFVVFTGIAIREPSSNLPHADGIVALTGGEARISEALKLLSQAYGKRLLISGVNPSTTRSELIHLNPESAALFTCCIDLDQHALDTIGNAEQTAAWIRKRGFKSLIVVTSSYHMPRSLIELRRALPDIELIPYPVTPPKFDVDHWWAHPPSLKLLVSEYVKLLPSLVRYTAARFFAEEHSLRAQTAPGRA